jgi:hypothetical protein
VSVKIQTREKAPAQSASASTPVRTNILQRKCACGRVLGPDDQCAECRRNQSQRRPGVSAESTRVLPTVDDALSSPGKPLATTVRAHMESHFGHDFSRVRVHDGAQAVRSARAVNALAYTVGHDVVFGAGQYSPQSRAGQRLLAHELAHVVQQSRGGPNAPSPLPSSTLEQAADRATSAVTQGGRPIEVVGASSTGLARQPRSLIQSLNPSALSDEELQQEITLIQQWLAENPVSSAENDQLSATLQVLESETGRRGRIQESVAHKRALDEELERDFDLIVRILDEVHYSDSDEGQVISKLRRWGEEKFTTNPGRYPDGGEYLDRLFSKLARKTKVVGVVVDEWTNYYNLIFNHFDRVDEVRAIRDTHSKIYKGHEGRAEVSAAEELANWKETAGEFWGERAREFGRLLIEAGVPEELQNLLGGIAGVIQGFAEILIELVEGAWSLLEAVAHVEGTILYVLTGAAEELGLGFLQRLPLVGKTFSPAKYRTYYEETVAFMKSAGQALQNPMAILRGIKNAAIQAWDEVIAEYRQADDFNKSRIIARGVVKVGMAVGGFIKNLPQMARTAASVARTGVKVAVAAGRTVARALRGIARIGGKLVRGAWDVIEEAVEGGGKRLRYYFRRVGAEAAEEIVEADARPFIHCSDCKITPEAEALEKRMALRTQERGQAILEEFESSAGTLEQRLTPVAEELGVEPRQTYSGRAPMPERFDVGNFSHKYAEQLIPESRLPRNLEPEFRIKLDDGSERRVDRVDWKKGKIYEIKPDSPEQVAAGKKQAQLYQHYMNEHFRGRLPTGKHSWEWEVVTYDRAAVRQVLKGAMSAELRQVLKEIGWLAQEP